MPLFGAIEAGGTKFAFKFLTQGPLPTPQPDGDQVLIGEQTVSLKDGQLVLGKFAKF